jgi:hypothetical protein
VASLPERDFVPVEDPPVRAESPVELPLVVLDPIDGWESRTSLFGEPER